MGTPVYRLWNGQDGVGSHHFTTDEGEVEWLVGQGWAAEDIAFYGVKEESNVVALADVQGLQADGTALKGDTLALVFGSTFGVPKNVAWYKNGAVVATDSTEFNQTHGSLIIITDRTGYGAGSYYAQVENTKGQVFKTNTISVVDEGLAVISDVTFNDNYEALTLFDKDDPTTYWSMAFFPEIAKETDMAVLDVTLNKDYDGTFYLEKSDVKKGSDIKSTAFTVGSKAASGSIIEVEKAKDFTNDNLAKANAAGYSAMKYVDNDGTTQYKILVAAFTNVNVTSFERGKDFRVIFDQTGKIKDSKSDDEWNATAATCPYVLAPTSIAVTDVQNDTATLGWTVTAYMGPMEAVWMNDYVQTAVTTINLYENDKQSTTGASGFGSIPKGLTAGKSEKSTTVGANKPYVYATLSAPKGIFGATGLDLTSDVISTPDEIAASVKIEQSELDASDFNVSVSKLRGGATAFLIGGSSTEAAPGTGGWYDDFVDNGKYIAVTHLDAGAAVNYTFEDAVDEFDDPDNGDIYAVVLVPDNTSAYTKAASMTALIEQKVSMIIPDTAMSNMAVVGGEIAIDDAFVGLDQYGNEMDWADDNGGLADLLATIPDWKLATLTSDADQDLTAGGPGVFTLEAAVAASGEGGADFTITLPALAGIVSKGDTYTYKLTPFQTLKLTCTQGANILAGDDIDDTMWTLTIE